MLWTWILHSYIVVHSIQYSWVYVYTSANIATKQPSISIDWPSKRYSLNNFHDKNWKPHTNVKWLLLTLLAVDIECHEPRNINQWNSYMKLNSVQIQFFWLLNIQICRKWKRKKCSFHVLILNRNCYTHVPWYAKR